MKDTVQIVAADVAEITIHTPIAKLWHVGMAAATKVVNDFFSKTEADKGAEIQAQAHLRTSWPYILVDGSPRTGKTQTARYILPAIVANTRKKPVHVAYISLTTPLGTYCDAFYNELALGLGDNIRSSGQPISVVAVKDLIKMHIPLHGYLVVVFDEIQNYCEPEQRVPFLAFFKQLLAWEQLGVIFVVTGSTGACLHQALDDAPPNGGTLHERAIMLLIPVSDDAGASILFPRLFTEDKATIFTDIKTLLLNVNPAYVAQYKALPDGMQIRQEIFNIFLRDLALYKLTKNRIQILLQLGRGQVAVGVENQWLTQWSSVVRVEHGHLVWIDALFTILLEATVSANPTTGEYQFSTIKSDKLSLFVGSSSGV
eukprot:TRINITY_DN15206_c0_g3_i1.p1 TRINITY_DN15206_c0_g3~~TRINITY_DN15206_c0_g3_i1.p1  ORF type:complete len:371 (-),score=52.68 TRINITY_DN15206_c0_g3_i1:390-1502(-)